jgi:hypothetical protein
VCNFSRRTGVLSKSISDIPSDYCSMSSCLVMTVQCRHVLALFRIASIVCSSSGQTIDFNSNLTASCLIAWLIAANKKKLKPSFNVYHVQFLRWCFVYSSSLKSHY